MNPTLHFPTRSDIFAGDSIYQTSDIVLVIHKPVALQIFEYGVEKWPTSGLVYLHALKYWRFIKQLIFNNSVNSGNILLKDNPDLSIINDNNVIMKEQRLTSEESTNNLDTSAEQSKEWVTFIDKWKQGVYKDFKQTYG